MQVTFTINTQPIAKGRPRLTTRGGFARAYTPRKTADYELAVRAACAKAMADTPPLEGPVAVVLDFYIQPPKSWSKRKKAAPPMHTGRPDLDNLTKSVLDGMNGVAWLDDGQVVIIRASKQYGDTPCIKVNVTELHGATP